MRPKNLSQLKKFLQPGVKLRMVKAPHLAPGQSLNREVVLQNSVDCSFKGDNIPEGRVSDMPWGKASDYKFDDTGFTQTRMGNELRYEYVEAVPERSIAPGVVCKCEQPGAFCPMHGRVASA